MQSTTRRVAFALASTLLLAAATPGLAQSLNPRLDELLVKAKLSKTKVSVVAIESDTGRVLMSRNPAEELMPASNMKLITSGCAALVLGPDFKFRTELLIQDTAALKPAPLAPPATPGAQATPASANPAPAPAPIEPRLILRGSGDPALGDPKLLSQMNIGVEDLLARWVGAVKKSGITSFSEFIVDDRIFDREYIHPTWPVGQLNRWYCAEVSGLTFYANLLAVFATPQGGSEPAALKLEPMAPWVELRNRTKSVKQGQQTVWAAWTGASEITVYGDARYSNEPVEVALKDTPEFVTRLVADRLAKAGIRVGKARLANPDENLDGGRVIQVIETPLSVVLRRCNTDSYNLYAECLIKRMGHDVSGGSGSWRTGAAVERMTLADRLGADAGHEITIADGSGMSRENRVTANIMARWLVELAKDSRSCALITDSLATKGEGTMEHRFEGRKLKNEVHAKSGYITGACTFSGYVVPPGAAATPGSKRIVFSILTNEWPSGVSVRAIKDFQEDVVTALDAWLAKQ